MLKTLLILCTNLKIDDFCSKNHSDEVLCQDTPWDGAKLSLGCASLFMQLVQKNTASVLNSRAISSRAQATLHVMLVALRRSTAYFLLNFHSFQFHEFLFTSSYLLLVVWPGAPSSVLAPSSDARSA